MQRSLGELLSIKSNEWESVLYFFLITTAFSFGSGIARTIGMTLLIEKLGSETLPQIFLGVDLTVMVASLAYAHYTRKFNELRILGFFLTSGAFFAGISLLLFALLPGWDWAYGLFFIGFFVFYVLISIHIFSVAGAYFTTVQLKRVTGFINAGLPIGGILAGFVVIMLLGTIPPQWLIALMGASYLLGTVGMRLVKTRLSPVRSSQVKTAQRKTPLKEFSTAFFFILRSPLMMYMSIGIVLFVVVSKMLEYQYQGIIYPANFPDPELRATFFATYEIIGNLAWLLIQLFFTSRILVGLGVGGSNLLYPVMTGLISFALLMNFGFVTGFFAQFINQEMRGALRSPANNLLYNAIPPNMWGATKGFINGLIFPLGTIIASTTLIFITSTLETSEQIVLLPLITFVVSMLGILVAIPQWRAYNEGVFGLLNRTLFAHRSQDAGHSNRELNSLIHDKLFSPDRQHVIASLEMIRVLSLKSFVHRVGELMRHTDDLDIKQHCVDTLAALPQTDATLLHLMNALKDENNPETLAMILRNLKRFDLSNEDLTQAIERYLLHPVPEVFIETCLCLYNKQGYMHKRDIEQRLLSRLKKPKLPKFSLYLYALGELRQARHSNTIAPFLEYKQADIRLAAFTAYIRVLEGQLDPYKERFIEALSSPSKDMKIAALRALKECSPLDEWLPVIRLLGGKDRALVNESRELLRINRSACQPALIDRVFSEEEMNEIVSVQERFEILSLIYSGLSKYQREQLYINAERALMRFVETQGLLMLHRENTRDDAIHELIEKILEEVAETHLLNVLTIITYEADENREFFQRISRGLQSDNRANQGNALEVLSNVSERQLAIKILKYYEENPKTLDALKKVYQDLFEAELELGPDNYLQRLLKVHNHPLLKASLYYSSEDRKSKLHLLYEDKNTRRLLGVVG